MATFNIARHFLQIMFVLCFVSALAGCGRNYSLVGRVIVIDGGTSSIKEVKAKNQIPTEANIGIANAKITLFHEIRDNKPDRNSTWQTSVEADHQGYFKLHDYATPGQENEVGLEISAEGYETVFITYIDQMTPDTQFFVVVLKKKFT